MSLQDEVKQLAKQANERLREIERQGLQSLSGQYQKVEQAQFDGMLWTDETQTGKIKFATVTKGRSDEELEEEKRQLKIFLNSGTTRVPHLKAKRDRLKQEYEEDMHTSISTEEFTERLAVDLLEEAYRTFGSDFGKLLHDLNVTEREASTILRTMQTKEQRNMSETPFLNVEEAFINWLSDEYDEEDE